MEQTGDSQEQLVMGKQGHCWDPTIYPGGAHPAELALERVLGTMKKPVSLLGITTLSQLRKDGHPSAYGFGGHRLSDCSHWCLPGVPDTWNQLLYATLI